MKRLLTILLLVVLVVIVACEKTAEQTAENRTKAIEEVQSQEEVPIEEKVEEAKATKEAKEEIVCPADLRECPSGTYVARVPPTCDFAVCPAPPREDVVTKSGEVIPKETPGLIKKGDFETVMINTTGHVEIIREEPRILLKFTGFKTEARPYLFVYLGKHDSPKEQSDLFQNGYIEVGTLRSAEGAQDYYVPGAFMTIREYNSVVIFDKTRDLIGAYATLQ